MSHNIKISIITVVYNGGKFIENSIKSVVNQKNDDVEYLIIDGASKDNTVEIVKKYEDRIDYFISEPDNGIADAWNKGVKQAKGDWIMFLGCDDVLVDGALAFFLKAIKDAGPELQYISSICQMVDVNGKKIRQFGWKWEWPLFLKYMTVAHPGSLHSRKYFEDYGYFDTDLKIVFDYEILLRAGASLKAKYIDFVSVIMREGGNSDRIAGIREHYDVVLAAGGYNKTAALANFYYQCMKNYSKKFLRKFGVNLYLRK